MSKVAIILLNYNGSKDTIKCLESLNYVSNVDFDVICVDNASEESDRVFLDKSISNMELKYKLFRIDSERNLGFAGGNNLGIKMALESKEYDSVLLLNNDTIVTPDFLYVLHSELMKSYGLTASRILFEANHNLLWSAGGYFNDFRGIGVNKGFMKNADMFLVDEDISFAPFCCVLISMAVFEKIGVMDESYFMYFEDDDFCKKINANGYKMKYCSNSLIYHNVSASSGGLRSNFYLEWMTRNRLKFIKKYYSWFTLLEAKAETWLKILIYTIKGKHDSVGAIKRGLK